MLETKLFLFFNAEIVLKKTVVTKYIFDWTIFEKIIATANLQFFEVFKKE